MKFNLARDALEYLIYEFSIKEIYVPYYLCDAIRHTIFKTGCKSIFYHIDDNFMPAVTLPENSYILYPNYFGICDKNVDKLVKIYPKLIVDNAHAFYAAPKGFASFNSERKFRNVEAGAYLWIGQGKNIFLKDMNRRKIFDNYHKIYSASNLLNIDILKDSIPFCYPYLAPSAEEADKAAFSLINQGKTVYRYWNNLPKSYNEYKFYSRLVPVPLD